MYYVVFTLNGYEVSMYTHAKSKGHAIAIAEREWEGGTFVSVESV